MRLRVGDCHNLDLVWTQQIQTGIKIRHLISLPSIYLTPLPATDFKITLIKGISVFRKYYFFDRKWVKQNEVTLHAMHNGRKKEDNAVIILHCRQSTNEILASIYIKQISSSWIKQETTEDNSTSETKNNCSISAWKDVLEYEKMHIWMVSNHLIFSLAESGSSKISLN